MNAIESLKQHIGVFEDFSGCRLKPAPRDA
jgi:hypothetical protein